MVDHQPQYGWVEYSGACSQRQPILKREQMALKYDLPTAGNVAGASPMIIRHRSAAAPDHPGRGARSNTNAEPTLIIRKDGTVCDRILKAGDSHVLRHMAEAVWVGGTLVVVVVGGGGGSMGVQDTRAGE